MASSPGFPNGCHLVSREELRLGLKMKAFRIAALLSFNGGFVDTAGFLGLQGLFTAHVTGNFVTLAAALVLGTHGIVAKLLALPEFVLVVALARVGGSALAWRRAELASRKNKTGKRDKTRFRFKTKPPPAQVQLISTGQVQW